jgi:hypothetical protein
VLESCGGEPGRQARSRASGLEVGGEALLTEMNDEKLLDVVALEVERTQGSAGTPHA